MFSGEWPRACCVLLTDMTKVPGGMFIIKSSVWPDIDPVPSEYCYMIRYPVLVVDVSGDCIKARPVVAAD